MIDTVYGLLLQAETSDPVNTTATLGYHRDQVGYDEGVREFVRKHATKSRAEWRETILGNCPDTESDAESEMSGGEEMDED